MIFLAAFFCNCHLDLRQRAVGKEADNRSHGLELEVERLRRELASATDRVSAKDKERELIQTELAAVKLTS